MLVNQLIETTTFDIYVSTRRHQTRTKWLVQWQVDGHVICLFAGRQVSHHCLLLMTRSDDFLLTYFINSFINSSMQQSHLTEIVYFTHKISRSTIPLLFDVLLINFPRHWENVGTVLPRLCTTRLRFSSFIQIPYFSALTLQVEKQEEHMTCKKFERWNACVVIWLERGTNDIHMVHLMPLPPHHLLLH